MNKIVECVPNFSEGRDRGIIDAIGAEISAVEGAALLDVDPGHATNRTVVTGSCGGRCFPGDCKGGGTDRYAKPFR